MQSFLVIVRVVGVICELCVKDATGRGLEFNTLNHYNINER